MTEFEGLSRRPPTFKNMGKYGILPRGLARREGSRLRVLVCGGRQFRDQAFLNAKLDELHRQYRFTALIEGYAKGADQMAGAWADANGIEHLVFRADWEHLKRKAGPIRNKRMLDEGKPDLVVAFQGKKGTANMCGQAIAAGVRVINIRASE